MKCMLTGCLSFCIDIIMHVVVWYIRPFCLWSCLRNATEVSLFWPLPPPLFIPKSVFVGLFNYNEGFVFPLKHSFPTLYLQPCCKSWAALGFCRTFPLNNFNKCLTCFQSSCRGVRLQRQPLRKCIYWPQPRIVQLSAFFVWKSLSRGSLESIWRDRKGEKVKIEKLCPFSSPQVVAV